MLTAQGTFDLKVSRRLEEPSVYQPARIKLYGGRLLIIKP